MSTLAREIYQPHRYTVDEYYRMAESGILNEKSRVELIEGEVIDMPPIGSPHSGLVNLLSYRLGQAAGDNAIVAVQNPVRLNRFSEPEPDIALLRPRADFYANAHPMPDDVLLIVEVSDSTLRYDRDIKTPLYAKYGIPEVWLVDVAGRELIIHRLPGKSGYTEIQRPTGRELIGLVALPEVKVDLSGLFG